MKKVFLLITTIMSLSVLWAEGLKIYSDKVVIENLRLRTAKTDGRKIVTVLNAGTKVKIIDIGDSEVIDGIESNWVQVEVQKNATNKDGEPVKYGVVGWCFGGYLKDTSQSSYTPDYLNGNGTFISDKMESETRIIIRKHNQKVKIGEHYSDEPKIIYKDTKKSQVLYTLKAGDEVQISEIWTYTYTNENLYTIWFKVKVNNNTGFLCYSEPLFSEFLNKYINDRSDPYFNNQWEVIETIKNNEGKWTVRKLQQILTVASKENKVELKSTPGDKSPEVVGYVPSSYRNGNPQINIQVEAITEETITGSEYDHWVRVTYDGKTGWMSSKFLSAERGGSRFKLPELAIDYSMSN